MADTLTYNPRTGTLTARIAGAVIAVPAVPAKGGRITTWEKSQELRSGAQRSDGRYVLTGVQHSAAGKGGEGRRLIDCEGTTFQLYDYPGAYAQRFDGGTDTRAKDDTRAGGAAILAGMIMQGGDPDKPIIIGSLPNPVGAPGGVPIPYPNIAAARGAAASRGAEGATLVHPWPPGPEPAIVVIRGWTALRHALGQTRQVSLVVEG